MTTTTKVLILSGILLLPALGMATDRVMTASSVDSAYKAQVAALDVEIAADQKDLATQKMYQGEYLTKKAGDELQQIREDREEKRQLGVTYKLLMDALQ